MRFHNQKGTVFYGMHMVDGVAEYRERGSEPHRIFINSDTLKNMDSTFAGRPVYVQHVDEVEEDLADLRETADGWVTKSFYNSADGKHWVEFIIVSDEGLEAVKCKWKLSNCYIPKSKTRGGQWNGVSYHNQITAGEYEHLAIVPNPRYEESVIMTPDEFKRYNEEKVLELKRLSNSKKEVKSMGLKFFKRSKVENSSDLADTMVVLPKSNREILISQLVTEADAAEVGKKSPRVVNGKDLVDVDGEKQTVSSLVTQVKALTLQVESLKNAKKKKDNEDDDEDEDLENETDCDDEMENESDEEEVENEDDDEEEVDAVKKKKKKEEDDEEVENEDDSDDEEEVEAAKKKNKKKKNKKKVNQADEDAARRKLAKAKADRLRNAQNRDSDDEVAVVNIGIDQVARGKSLYGS